MGSGAISESMGAGTDSESAGGTRGALESAGGTSGASGSIGTSGGASEPRRWSRGTSDWLGRPEVFLFPETTSGNWVLAAVFPLEIIFDLLGWTRGWHPMLIYDFGRGNAM